MNITTQTWLAEATDRLAKAGVATARLDALVLLEDALHTNRALLLAHPETELTAEHITVLDSQIARRARHEPLAYIRGRAEFYGRQFAVDKNVLVPRPESEMMIEMLLTLPRGGARSVPGSTDGTASAGTTIVDIGTGSGALAIMAKLELPDAPVIATDINTACLKVAGANAERLGASIKLMQGDLLQPLAQSQLKGAILLCNLPYVPEGYAINQAAGHEPRLALFAGPDGLDAYRQLFGQLSGRQPEARPKFILAESLPEQHAGLAALAQAAGYGLERASDFIQLYRLPAEIAS